MSEGQRTALVHTRERLRSATRAWPGQRAVVMTLGALHEGHASLIRAAREQVKDGCVVVTVFVNPLQFGAGEDFARYPRTLDADLALAREAGADVVFAPQTAEVYPAGEPLVRIAAGAMGQRLEGAARPGHFDGMLTVVAKLFHIVRPDVAFFGQKDAQQVALIRRMAQDLDFVEGLEIVTMPTVREADGLARSSRNGYLSADERATALALSQALFAGRSALPEGPTAVRRAARAILADRPGLAVDYLALVDPVDFTEVPEGHTGQAVLAVAAKVGSTRLIDNVPLDFGRDHA